MCGHEGVKLFPSLKMVMAVVRGVKLFPSLILEVGLNSYPTQIICCGVKLSFKPSRSVLKGVVNYLSFKLCGHDND